MTIYNVAKTVVLNSSGKVLLIRRSKTDDRRPGEWDFPGGHIDDGEDVAEAAAREASEEAGLQVAASDLTVIYAATAVYEPEDRSITRFLLLCRLADEPTVQLSFEHDEYQWVDVDTAIRELSHTFYGVGLRHAQTYHLL